METTVSTRVPFGWHFAEELPHSPMMGEKTKTQSPVWTDNKGDGAKPGGGVAMVSGSGSSGKLVSQ